jgi:hypothetical protein
MGNYLWQTPQLALAVWFLNFLKNQFINLKNYGNLSLHYEIHAKEEYTYPMIFICLFLM